jgi:hypothetical protein
MIFPLSPKLLSIVPSVLYLVIAQSKLDPLELNPATRILLSDCTSVFKGYESKLKDVITLPFVPNAESIENAYAD